ncbi:YihY/virulence factor BrkB family protein [Seohaeicola zhoushanensis]
MPHPITPADLPLVLWTALRRFERNGGWTLASHVAMSLMLALFPFFLFVVALAGALSSEPNVDQLTGLILSLWPDAIGAPVVAELRAVLANGSVQLVTLGGALALYFASNGVDAVRLAITRAYRDIDPRPFWKTRALCLAFVLVGGTVLLAGLTFGVGLPAYFHLIAERIPDPYGTWFENRVLKTAVVVLLLLLGVAACHIWLPGMRHRFGEVWPGVVLTVLLWFGAVWGFSYYMQYFANYSATYAGLAGAMAALIFLYLIGAILILGAEFNAALLRRRDGIED